MKMAIDAKRKIKKILSGVSGISGIGLTWDADGTPCVKVNVNSSIEKLDRNKIPSRIDNVKVRIETIDNISRE
jgi:hypothetical protein